MVGLNAILKEAWNTSQQARQEREKIQALSLTKQCYSMKLDLLTNAAVVDDAIRFVSDRSNDRQVIAMNMMARKNQMSLTIIKTKIS